jgi:hypothetical protein
MSISGLDEQSPAPLEGIRLATAMTEHLVLDPRRHSSSLVFDCEGPVSLGRSLQVRRSISHLVAAFIETSNTEWHRAPWKRTPRETYLTATSET